jgi:deoxyribodipyrimidine photo-lyase
LTDGTLLDLSADTLHIIARDFEGLYSLELGLSSIKGGQTAADRALGDLDITGYASTRSEVLPRERRGASVLSPYIRHNILTLDRVHRGHRVLMLRVP